jgi:hypothetical protein
MRRTLWTLTAALVLASATRYSKSQQTTDTNCTLYGNTANCTSTTTDHSADNQRSYEAGQQVGNAIGVGLARAIGAGRRASWVKKFCAHHPGSGWHWGTPGNITDRGTCPTSADERVEAANAFIAKHKDYVPEPANGTVMVAYIDAHNLDPRQEKSYERGYKDLKKSGQLHLYSK